MCAKSLEIHFLTLIVFLFSAKVTSPCVRVHGNPSPSGAHRNSVENTPGGLLGNPAVANILKSVLSEDQRLKLGKDFIRYTKNITTEFDKEQATDSDGNLLWDDVKERVQDKNTAGDLLWVDEDGNEYTKDDEGNFVDSAGDVVEGLEAGALAPKMIERVKQQQVKDADGNLVFKDSAGATFTKDAQGVWRDAAGEIVEDVDADAMTAEMENVQTPRLKNRTAARMVGVTEDAWEKYISDEPVWLTQTKQEQAKDAEGLPVWIVDGVEVASWTDPTVLGEDGEPTNVVTKKMVDAEEKVAKRDDEGKIIYQEKTRHFKKPVMVQQEIDGKKVWQDAPADATDFVWMNADGEIVTPVAPDPDDEDAADPYAGLTKKVAVMTQKMEQAKDSNGNPIWDPVVAKTVTAHWLTSDYGLREPLVIEWLGHQLGVLPGS